MRGYAAALALMPLIFAPMPAQIGVDAEMLKLVTEMELTRMAVGGFAAALLGFLGIAWRAQANQRSAQTQAAEARQSETQERERFLALMWAMQGTQQQTKDAILAANTGYQAQVEALKAHTDALAAQTAESKAFRSEIDRELKGIRRAVNDGQDKIGKMVKDGIEAGMKAAAGVFAEHNAAAITPLVQQIASLNARLGPQEGDTHDALSHAHFSGAVYPDGDAGPRAGDAPADADR